MLFVEINELLRVALIISSLSFGFLQVIFLLLLRVFGLLW